MNRALRRILYARLRTQLRPADELMSLGYRLSEWVTHGATATGAGGVGPGAGGAVELRVARYYERAASTGRRWGVVLGLLLGAGLAAVILLATWMWMEVTA